MKFLNTKSFPSAMTAIYTLEFPAYCIHIETPLTFLCNGMPPSGIKGNITLDTAFPSPRAFFADNKSNFREVSLVATNRETECLQYPVMVKVRPLSGLVQW